MLCVGVSCKCTLFSGHIWLVSAALPLHEMLFSLPLWLHNCVVYTEVIYVLQSLLYMASKLLSLFKVK